MAANLGHDIDQSYLSEAVGIEANSSDPAWKETVDIFWSAGPITFIALNFGHLFAFGSFASTKQYLYFGMYTLIAGFVSVGSKKMIFREKRDKRVARDSLKKIKSEIEASEKLEKAHLIRLLEELTRQENEK